jgi:lysozyme
MKQNSGASMEFVRGVDITDQHGVVDWNSAAAAGVTFAYVMATRGSAEQARHSLANWQEMKRAGVLRGACHYFQPLQDPEAQAHYFSSVAAQHTDLPPSLRLKAVPTHTGLNEWDGVRKERRRETVMSCLAVIEKDFGRKPILFTNAWFLQALGDHSGLRDYDLWLADYTAGDAPLVPAPWSGWKFWRYSESGLIAGITGRFCLDRFNGAIAALRQFGGAPPAEAETPEARKTVEASPVTSGAVVEESDSGEDEKAEEDKAAQRTAKPKPRIPKREEKSRTPESSEPEA